MTQITHLLARPMLQNVPELENAVIVKCLVCGRACWKRDIEPDPLPPGVEAVCTSCALTGRTPLPAHERN